MWELDSEICEHQKEDVLLLSYQNQKLFSGLFHHSSKDSNLMDWATTPYAPKQEQEGFE